jgi:hypothetical protein
MWRRFWMNPRRELLLREHPFDKGLLKMENGVDLFG